MTAACAAPFRRTKIVATLGPVSCSRAVLADLVASGVDVVRINSSHGRPEERGAWIDMVREVADAAGRYVGVLVDLQGPRIRVGVLEAALELVEGKDVVFAPEDVAEPGEIPTTYSDLARDVHPGSRVLLNDGLLAVEVTQVEVDRVRGVVRHGGALSSGKGMNLPDVEVSAPAVTDRDRETLAVAVSHGVDLVGISFVQRAADVEAVRALVPPATQLIAKIERGAALQALPEILEAADGLMVARGDLGVELPFEEVPLAQKHIIAHANRGARPVITATQMLESMIGHPRPTRAEVSDVANAILDGTDAVMLSAETAVGAYPVEAVRATARIIEEVEGETVREATRHRRSSGPAGTVEEAIAFATTAAAELLDVPAIVCLTKSGFTARVIAAHRPSVRILGISTEETTCRCLALVWGVQPMLAEKVPTFEVMLGRTRDRLLRDGTVHGGDRLVVTAGVPFDVPGTTNLMQVVTV
jgi:pyruvate kinase